MTQERAIQIWLHDDVPDRIAKSIANFDDACEPAGYCVCHIPQAVVESDAYQMAEALPPLSLGPGLVGDERIKWLPMTGNHLFGTNACDILEHPDGDGIVIAFSNI